MKKLRQTDFKKFLASLNEAELRGELQKLFAKFPAVQEFYGQELMDDAGRASILADYKNRIYKQFWTSKGNPRKVSKTKLREIIADFERISVFPHELADLMLYRVEVALEQYLQFSSGTEADITSLLGTLEKTMKLVQLHQLEDLFRARAAKIAQLDYVPYGYRREFSHTINLVFDFEKGKM